MRGIRIENYGGAEALKLEEIKLQAPGPGQALVKIKAAGVNFIDVYERKGLYKNPLPYAPGREGAGVVEQVGSGAGALKPGDRVAWAGIAGSYATHLLAPADRLVPLPEALSFEQGAACMLQGMTAHYLAYSAYPLKPGDSCLVHAAAGGVGALLCQMAKRIGAVVYGTVSTEEKAKIAKEAGADETIFYTRVNFDEEVKRLTGGKGVNVVYDSVGIDTFEKSLNSLAHRGYLVLFGQSSGPVPPFDPQILNAKGSLFFTRPTLVNYIETRKELLQRAGDVHDWIGEGLLRLRIDRVFPLSRAADAHEELESRRTAGKVILSTED